MLSTSVSLFSKLLSVSFLVIIYYNNVSLLTVGTERIVNQRFHDTNSISLTYLRELVSMFQKTAFSAEK